MKFEDFFTKVEEAKRVEDDPHALFSEIISSGIEPYQQVAYLSQIILTHAPEPEKCDPILLNDSADADICAAILVLQGLLASENPASTSPCPLLEKVFYQTTIRHQDVADFVVSIKDKTISLELLALTLMVIKIKGLNPTATEWLTKEMANSGQTYDYRENVTLGKRKIVRRYPTGALSEKTALIMPALLKCFARDLPLCSPFLVARTLSFTGGTWDKLLSIDGFIFPKPGDETLRILKKGNIAMSVTNGGFNPADRFLYQFRSLTDTVTSEPLIISSIASKQIAIPADSLVLDVRFGNGAFIPTLSAANSFFEKISPILRFYGIDTKAIYTPSLAPTGSCIGNYWEVLEAIAVMKGDANCMGEEFNPLLLQVQRDLVIQLTVELVHLQFGIPKTKLEKTCYHFFRTGQVASAFLELLQDHSVSEPIRTAIGNGLPWKTDKLFRNKVIAIRDGAISEVLQKNIGNYVNFKLGGGFNDLHGSTNRLSGFILKKWLGDKVQKGETVAEIISTFDIGLEDLNPSSYFRF